MVMVKDLTELKLADLWREVKSEEEWWGEISEQVLEMVKLVLEVSLEEEIVEELRAARYQRVRLRRGYRNGHYERGLYTRFGIIKSLRVPRTRGNYPSVVLPRYQRRPGEVNRMVRDMFLAGVSTRRVSEVLAHMLGQAPSAQTVSRVVRSLDEEVRRFQHRALPDKYCYLLLDGITLKVKEAGGVKKRLVLCVYGVTSTGQREIIDFRQATAESEAQWEAFLRNLYNRGLVGNALKLVVTDGCPGLHRALDMVYPYVPRQRCWVHKLRNVAARLPRKVQESCLTEAKGIYLSSTRREAKAHFEDWEKRWRPTQPRAVACLETDLEELLSFLDCPKVHWRKIRTTNAIERAFREVRRRVRPMSCFNNPASVDRIIYGITSHLNLNWKDKPIPQFTHNT